MPPLTPCIHGTGNTFHLPMHSAKGIFAPHAELLRFAFLGYLESCNCLAFGPHSVTHHAFTRIPHLFHADCKIETLNISINKLLSQYPMYSAYLTDIQRVIPAPYQPIILVTRGSVNCSVNYSVNCSVNCSVDLWPSYVGKGYYLCAKVTSSFSSLTSNKSVCAFSAMSEYMF